MIPHDGQGESLPPDFPFVGEWLIRNHVFVYRPDGTEAVGGAAPRMTRGWVAEDGNWRLGFDAEQIAAMFGIDTDAVFAANQSGTLKLDGTLDVLPTHGGEKAKMYAFSLGDKKRAVTIEKDPPSGSS